MLIYFPSPDFLQLEATLKSLQVKQPEVLFPTTVSGIWPLPFPARDEQSNKTFPHRNMFLHLFERKSRSPVFMRLPGALFFYAPQAVTLHEGG